MATIPSLASLAPRRGGAKERRGASPQAGDLLAKAFREASEPTRAVPWPCARRSEALGNQKAPERR